MDRDRHRYKGISIDIRYSGYNRCRYRDRHSGALRSKLYHSTFPRRSTQREKKLRYLPRRLLLCGCMLCSYMLCILAYICISYTLRYISNPVSICNMDVKRSECNSAFRTPGGAFVRRSFGVRSAERTQACMAVQQPERTRQLEINACTPQPKARCTYHECNAAICISNERAFVFKTVRSRSFS